MARRAFNFLTVVSLLVATGAAALWVRSRGVSDMAGLMWGAQSVWATSRDGRVELEWQRWPAARGRKWQHFSFPSDPAAPPPRTARRAAPPPSRFHAYRGTTGGGTPRWGVMFPHWVALAPAAMLPAAWLAVRFARRRRLTAGLCPACGYDLRASGERCPECGSSVESRATGPAPPA